MAYRPPPPEMMINNRDEARIKAETWPESLPHITADMALVNGMHHLSATGTNIERTHEFYGGLLGMHLVKRTSNFDDPNSAHWYWGVDEGKPGTVVTYFERHPASTNYARMGAGQTYHFALAVSSEEEQREWRDKLLQAGYRVSPVMDRIYFKSIYTNDPDGHIVELATVGPGFLSDESADELGSGLKLPPWLEPERTTIANRLKPLMVPTWHTPETT